ncbi:MAG TPA: CvpA family protein [candidate division Zixibacteria bacterium]|nr:CvpA family protein [candidate division Zixibacteria bacterium]
MSLVDLILLVLLFLFGLRGYFKGLFREVLSVGGLVFGFYAATRHGAALAELAGGYWKFSPILLKSAAFVAVFFTVYFLFALAGWLLHRSEKFLFLHTVNRVGGIAVGLGKGTVVAALLLFFLRPASWIPSSLREQMDASLLAPPFSQLGEKMVRFGKERLFPENARGASSRTV